MAKLNRIESRDYFPLDKRLQMKLNLMSKTLSTGYLGREAKEPEVFEALWKYHEALSNAEMQIERLQELVRSLTDQGSLSGEMEDYLEDFEDLSPEEELEYNIQERKQALYHAMINEDEVHISMFSNQLNILIERKNKLENEDSNSLMFAESLEDSDRKEISNG